MDGEAAAGSSSGLFFLLLGEAIMGALCMPAASRAHSYNAHKCLMVLGSLEGGKEKAVVIEIVSMFSTFS